MSHLKDKDWKATMPNMYGLDHDKVKAKFEGELTYKGTFAISKSSHAVAVYHNAKPNIEKNHKEYMLLFLDARSGNLCVAGMTRDEMDKERYQNALHCLKCDEIIYSLYRHNDRQCHCGACMIDGGKNYTHISGNPEDYRLYTIDLLREGIVTSSANFSSE
jgi:hypothetical protein